MSSRVKSLAGNVLLALVSLTLALGAGEILLRTLSEPQLGFRYENRVFGMAREYVKDSRRNALGFHDREHGPKVASSSRVLLLGDSYVEGYSVALEETVGARLEHHLNQAGLRTYDVVSMGQSGWSQAHQLPALREHGLGIDADFVVTLFLSFNDVAGNSKRLTRRIESQLRLAPGYFRGRPGWCVYRAEEVPLFWFERSKLNQLVSYRLAIALRDRDRAAVPIDYLVYAAQPGDVWEAAWEWTESLFLRTRDEVERSGARYAVVAASTPHGVWGAEEGRGLLERVYPALAAIELDLDGPDRRLAGFLAAEQIPFLALEPHFRREQTAGAVLHWPFDGHWNAAGNDLAGRLMASFILDLDRRDES